MNFSRPLILASKSPRRQQLLKEAGFTFEVMIKEIDESYPQDLNAYDVAAYLSKKKADAFDIELDDKILITSDTTVVFGDTVLGKPSDKVTATEMLKSLSGHSHDVVTAVTLTDVNKQQTVSSKTRVYFKQLSDVEIEYYLDHYKPYDKAGAYGIQEWIGMIGIEKIEGSYFNVVGLPIHELYEALNAFS